MSCGRKIGPYDCCTAVEGNCIRLLAELSGDGMVLLTDPPYGVAFTGKNTKHTTRRGAGYLSNDDPEIGPVAVELAMRYCVRGAVFPGTRQLFRYPVPRDVGCVYCPSGAGIGTWGWTCFHPILFYGTRPSNALFPTSITSFETAEPNGHPCPKPLGWMRWLVSLCSAEGETIIDPFGGSGTTAIAARKMGRHFLLFERESEYNAIARDRLARFDAQPTLFEPKPEQLNL